MVELSEELKRAVWQRDGFRCQECGVAVAQKNGCKPQTHHIKPRSAGGTDEQGNLITLCVTCHATKNSLGHKNLFIKTATTPKDTPSHIKWLLWEISTDLLVFTENLSPLNFPAQQVLHRIQQLGKTLESVRELTLDAIKENPRLAENKSTVPYESPETQEAILRGVKISYWSRHQQEVLDEEVRGDSPMEGASFPT